MQCNNGGNATIEAIRRQRRFKDRSTLKTGALKMAQYNDVFNCDGDNGAMEGKELTMGAMEGQ